MATVAVIDRHKLVLKIWSWKIHFCLLVGEWSWRLGVDVAGADAMVEEKEAAEFMKAGRAVTGRADLAVSLRGPLDECLADA